MNLVGKGSGENKRKLARRHYFVVLPYYYEKKNTYFFRVRRVTCRRRCGCLLRRRGRIRRGKRRRNSPASGRRRGRVPSPSMSRWVSGKSFGSAPVFVHGFLMTADFEWRLKSDADPDPIQAADPRCFFPVPIFSFPDPGLRVKKIPDLDSHQRI